MCHHTIAVFVISIWIKVQRGHRHPEHFQMSQGDKCVSIVAGTKQRISLVCFALRSTPCGAQYV